MAFIETRFPVHISYGSTGGPQFSTDVVELDSGSEQRLVRWPVGRHKFDAASGIHSLTDYNLVLAQFHTVKGKGHGFRWKDWADFKTADTVTHTDCELVDASGVPAVGDGVTTVFYLAKKYTFGGATVYRPITKPIASTVKIGKGGTLQTLTTHYTLNSTTGAVTFTSAPLAAVVLTGGCEFDVPVRFDTDYMPMRFVNRGGNDFYVDFEIPVIEVRP